MHMYRVKRVKVNIIIRLLNRTNRKGVRRDMKRVSERKTKHAKCVGVATEIVVQRNVPFATTPTPGGHVEEDLHLSVNAKNKKYAHNLFSRQFIWNSFHHEITFSFSLKSFVCSLSTLTGFLFRLCLWI